MVIRETKGDRIFNAVDMFLLVLVLIFCAYPIWFVIIASFSDPTLVSGGQVFLWPKGFTLAGYQAVFKNDDIGIGYLNTIFYTVFGTLLDLAITISAGYALSRSDMVGRNLLTIIFTITMFFGGGMIPSYLVVEQLGLLDTRAILVISGATGMFNILMCRTFFQTSIPGELQDAAEIDGCNNLQIFAKVVLPLSKPIIAVMVLFFAIGHWNDYFTAMLYTTNPNLKPLQLVLQDILINSDLMLKMLGSMPSDPEQMQQMERTKDLVRYAVIIISSLPVMCLYPLVQKYFVKGIMIGSIKG